MLMVFLGMFMVSAKSNQNMSTGKGSYLGKLTTLGVSRSHFVAMVKIVAFLCVVELKLKEQPSTIMTVQSC